MKDESWYLWFIANVVRALAQSKELQSSPRGVRTRLIKRRESRFHFVCSFFEVWISLGTWYSKEKLCSRQVTSLRATLAVTLDINLNNIRIKYISSYNSIILRRSRRPICTKVLYLNWKILRNLFVRKYNFEKYFMKL